MPAADALPQPNMYDWQRMVRMKTCSFNDAFNDSYKKKQARDKEPVLCETIDGLKISKMSTCLSSAMKKLCIDPEPLPAAMPSAKTTSKEF